MSNDSDWSHHLGRIRADMQALSKAVAGLATETAEIKGSIGQRIGTVAGQVSEFGHELIDDGMLLGSDAMQSVARTAEWAAEAIEDQIERNPLVSVLAAVGFGFALGFLSRGHRPVPPRQVARAVRRRPVSPRPKRR